MIWYESMDQLPDIDDYDIIKGKRTYRYFDGNVLYPFGYGLSYTTFTRTVESFDFDGETVTEKVTVKNTGDVQGKEVVTVFVEAPQGKLGKAAKSE